MKFETPPWTEIDTVMFDMDGTLLDLQFDNYFFLELIPETYAEINSISKEIGWRKSIWGLPCTIG